MEGSRWSLNRIELSKKVLTTGEKTSEGNKKSRGSLKLRDRKLGARRDKKNNKRERSGLSR